MGLLGVALVLTNAFAHLEFAADGRLAALSDTVTGRELADPSTSFVEVRFEDGSRMAPKALTVRGDRLKFDFPNRVGACELQVRPFDGGWTFETLSCSVSNAESLVFARVRFPRACKKGHISNVLMDDASAVVIRGYTPDIDMNGIERGHQVFYDPTDRTSYAAVHRKNGFVGKRAGLSAGPRSRILDMLKGMSRAAGVVTAGCGGAWSLESEANRESYLFAIWMDANSVEDFIDLARRAGCQRLHFNGWNRNIGHYDVDEGCFPDGLEGVRKAVAKIHAAGMTASFHTLSAAVHFGDAWIAPEWFDDFQTDANYTLARPYRRGERTLYVNERPWSGHARILTGGSNGNILRLGDDLLEYEDFTVTPPYAFTGVKMAHKPYGEESVYDDTQAVDRSDASPSARASRARQLSRAMYAAGAPVSYLHHRYGEFFPKPGSRLAEKVTDAIARVYNACAFDGIYLDGAEGFNSRESIDAMRMRTIEKLKGASGNVVNATSSRNPFNWWFRSLFGTFDHPNYGVKSYHDRHIRVYKDLLEADLLATDLGWWNVRLADANGRGYFWDEAEYFGCKSAAWDSTVSVMSVFYGDRPLGFSEESQLTLTGWWMNARYARAFQPALMKRMRMPGKEFRLRQSDSGEWTVTPFATLRHRVATADFATWVTRRDVAPAGSSSLRIEALYGADRTGAATNAIRLVDASMLGRLVRSFAEGVEMRCSAGYDDQVGATIRISARNVSARKTGSWACLGRRLDVRDTLAVNPVSVIWVKGDGSGATLNVQVRKHPNLGEAGCSENLVKLDFTGWRQVELLLRERDADESAAFEWPYENTWRLNTPAGVFRAPICGKTVGELNFWLNGIAPGRSATVELGAWDSVPLKKTIVGKGSALVVNGSATVLPFSLTSGEFAELTDDGWTHYAENGDPICHVSAADGPALRTGENEIAWRPSGSFARVEVTLFPKDDPLPAFASLTEARKRCLHIEYELPRLYDPKKGFDGRYPVRVRPGERARLGFEIMGPIENPTVNGCRIPVSLANEMERIVCRDGVHWKVVRWIPGKTNDDTQLRDAMTRREVLSEGALGRRLELKSGTNWIDVTSETPRRARISLVKIY